MTYSVAVRRGPDLVVASGSAWPRLGGATWVAAGRRLVVVQGRADRDVATELASAPDGITTVLDDDQQALVVDDDRLLVATGPACWGATSDHVGTDAAAASNCSTSTDVARRMTAAAATRGDTVDAALAALAAGAAAGGDGRGTAAAYLVHVDATGRVHDWRVDWGTAPLDQLRTAIDVESHLEGLYAGGLGVETVQGLLGHAERLVRFWAAVDLQRRGVPFELPSGLTPWQRRRLQAG